MDDEHWQNVEIRIVFPVQNDGYDSYSDERFDALADLVFDIYDEPVMSSRLFWSDEE